MIIIIIVIIIIIIISFLLLSLLHLFSLLVEACLKLIFLYPINLPVVEGNRGRNLYDVFREMNT